MKKSEVYFFMMCLVTFFMACLFLYLIGIDAIMERNPYQFFADSNTYHGIYSGDDSLFNGELIGVSSNYLGPIALLSLADGNFYFVSAINFTIYFLSVVTIARYMNCNPIFLGATLLLNPITISSLLSVNKEIFAYPLVALAAYAHQRHSLALLFLALLTALLSRWQLAVAVIALLSLEFMPTRSRFIKIIILLITVSVGYYLAKPLFGPVIEFSELSIDSYDDGGSGIFAKTLDIQNNGLYIFAFPIKALHLLFGMGAKLFSVFDYSNFYNDVVIVLHSFCLFVFTAICYKNRKLNLQQRWIYIGTVFLGVFCITPVFAPRYLYPIHIILCLTLFDRSAVQRIYRGRTSVQQ